MSREPQTEAARAVFDDTHGISLGGWVEMADEDAKALYLAIEDEARTAALDEVATVLQSFQSSAQREDYPQDRFLDLIERAVAGLRAIGHEIGQPKP